MKPLKIKKDIYNQMITHASEGLPNEACGYLAGQEDTITKFYPMTNVDQSPEHFSFDPKEQFAVVKDARKEKLSLLSVYHSHPETPARLSDEDIHELNDPNTVYIIVSLKDEKPDAKGYTLAKPDSNTIEITRVTLEIV